MNTIQNGDVMSYYIIHWNKIGPITYPDNTGDSDTGHTYEQG